MHFLSCWICVLPLTLLITSCFSKNFMQKSFLEVPFLIQTGSHHTCHADCDLQDSKLCKKNCNYVKQGLLVRGVADQGGC